MLILNGISAGRNQNCLLACRPIGMIEIPAGRGRHFHFSVGEILILISTGRLIVQELCESRGGRPGLSVLTSLLVSVDVKIY